MDGGGDGRRAVGTDGGRGLDGGGRDGRSGGATDGGRGDGRRLGTPRSNCSPSLGQGGTPMGPLRPLPHLIPAVPLWGGPMSSHFTRN